MQNVFARALYLLAALWLVVSSDQAGAVCTGQFGAFQTCSTGSSAGVPGPRSSMVTLSTKTSNYSVAAADCMTEFTLGGSTQFTLTLGAASGYSSGCRVVAYNSDAAAAKTLAVSGYSNRFLWPNQTISYVSTGSAWIIESDPGRWLVTAATTIFVAPGACGGVDTNDGLSSTRALALAQTAYGRVQTQWDLLAPPKIKFTCPTTPFTVSESVSMFGTLSGTMLIGIEGDPTTPSNVVWDPGADNTYALLARDFIAVDLNGIKFNTAHTGVTFLNPSQGGIIDFRNIDFGAAPGGFHMLVNPGGYMTWTGGTYVVSGSMAYHRFVQGGRVDIPNVGSISVPNALTFTQWDAIFQSGAVSYNGAISFTGAGAGAGSTGTKYVVSTGGSLTLNTTVLPGNAAGSANTFGSVLNPNFPSAYTGTGDLVFATSPTLVTPILGNATATTITNPVLYGGNGAGSSLTLQSTSGAGTTDQILLKVGNNGAVTGGVINTSGHLIAPVRVAIGANFTPAVTAHIRTGTDHNMEIGNDGTGTVIQELNDARAAFASITFNADPVVFQRSSQTRLTLNSSGNTFNNGIVAVSDSTAATTTTDGSLRTAGGFSAVGAAVIGGAIRSNTGFNANGSAGQSVTTTVRASGGAADCTLIFTFGIKTGGTC